MAARLAVNAPISNEINSHSAPGDSKNVRPDRTSLNRNTADDPRSTIVTSALFGQNATDTVAYVESGEIAGTVVSAIVKR